MEALRLSAPPLSNRGLARTRYLWVVPRAEAVVWSVLITRLSAAGLPVGVKSSFGETRSSFGGNTSLVARPYGWCEWDRGSPIVSDGGTNFTRR